MGCDIHAYIEKTYENGYIDLVSQVYLGRDYDLFGLLAGVRSFETPLVKPRGLPKETSYILQYEYCDYDREKDQLIPNEDFHTHSWLTVDELKKTYKRYKKLFPENGKNLKIKAIIKFMEILNKNDPNSTRFVFWFDS